MTPRSDQETVVHRQQIELPVRTIAKVLATALLVWAALRLWPLLLMLVVAVLIAITLAPASAWLERRGLSRGVAAILIGALFFGLLAGAAVLVIPSLSEQISSLLANLPRYRDRVERMLPPGQAMLHKVVQQVFALPTSPEVAALMAKPLVWGRAAVEVVTGFLMILILSLYLLVDGKGVYAWLLAYVPRTHRARIGETAEEIDGVVKAYVLGQLVTSVLCALFTLAVLYLLKVPGAVALAVLAGLLDVVPVVGIVFSTVPAVLLALTVSPMTALAVLASFLVYHLVETYVLVPKIYGQRLRLSTLSVLLALFVGGALQGILGGILILPFVAAYPVIERIWLRDYLGREVVRDHDALAEAAEAGSDHVVEAVLRGDGTGTYAPATEPEPVKRP